MVFAQTAGFYNEHCPSPSLIHTFEVSWGTSNWWLKNCMAIVKQFYSLVRMHTNHLATKH